MYPHFRGTGVALITPFKSNLQVDYGAFKRLLEHLIAAGVEYLVPLGTTGETATISKEEKKEIFTFVMQTVAGRLPLVAGIGGNNTEDILESFRTMEIAGYQAILSVSPYYNKPSQEGIYQHYKKLAAHSPLPIILYNVPSRTGSNITAETTLRLAADCSNIIGIKEASGDFEQCTAILRHKPKGFLVISGDDAITLPLCALGGDGVISVVANAFPEDFGIMTRLCLKGDFAGARPLHNKLADIIRSLFTEGSPSGIKAYLSEMGLVENVCRLPVVPVSEKFQARIRGYLLEYKKN
ncbi:MAG TPA: 4-hydroxy-tetrahydrodipicolinate synthase [Chitinophagaceae bacterium]|nr:4-hydroxy-tetrahydrodipicolinate synthase [Chitinophagaceae bacterium]